MPDMEGVKEAYLGILPAIEYLQLVVDEAGMIRKSLFYDNVRDFQSYNPVNQGIQKTLRDSTARGRFAVLNNGVTIVAKALRATGNKILSTTTRSSTAAKPRTSSTTSSKP
jgi:AIPR protein